MGWLELLITGAGAAWSAWSNWQKAQEEQRLAEQSYEATVAALHQQAAEQHKLITYFSYGVLGIGIMAFIMKR